MEALESCLDGMREDLASTVHLRGGEPPWWRIEGELVAQGDPLPAGPAFEKLLLDLADEHGARRLDALASHTLVFERAEHRYRMRIERSSEGWGALVRPIPPRPPTPEELGLPEALAASVHMRRGLIVLSSRAGGGRTTTLASMLRSIDALQQRYVVHVERPIEFRLRGERSVIHQIEVPVDVADFAGGVRCALGAGANVLALGDVPDGETLELLLDAVEAGMLVYAALEARNAHEALALLLDRIPAEGGELLRARLVSALRWVAWQALVRDTHGSRVAAVEMLEGNMALATAVKSARGPDDFRIAGRSMSIAGQRSYEAALEQLVVDGRVSPEEAERARAAVL